MTTNECQRYFGYSKRIPRDVKRHCGMCRQHGLVVETRGHICRFKNCTCEKCVLIRQRRSIMSTQIRLRRQQDKRFQRTTNVSEADVIPLNGFIESNNRDDTNLCYFCQKCKNHGFLMWKKDHKKNCNFANCRCEQCDLIDTRRALDRYIKKCKDINTEKSNDDVSSLNNSEEIAAGYDNINDVMTIPALQTSPIMETIPSLKLLSDVTPPISTIDATQLMLPNIIPAFFSAQYYSTSNITHTPISSLMYGTFLSNLPNDFHFTNIFNTFSPFELQLLLASSKACSDTGL
ncbi:DM DNA binding domain protein [Dictyocaulus viviparus]|uniref:DM DNA binding domain protein n=1 Tax=Dictyocaulus viviparus TaxID=29172 RepID=A0A0D8Y6I8_DICVI|nr:DM DNA binding domain protein [Dictyocaulus viviparus]